MYLNNFRLTGFMNHVDTYIEFAKLTFIDGVNNAGKTGILDAFSQLLTGRSSRINPDKGVDRRIDGGKIVGNIEDLGVVERRVGENELQVADWAGNLTRQQDALYKHLGVGKKTVQAMMSWGSFIDLAPADQKEMVFFLLNIKLRHDELVKEFLKFSKTADPLNRLNIDKDDSINPEGFKDILKVVTDGRRDAKRDLKKLEAQERPALPEIPEEAAKMNLEGAKEILQDLRDSKDKLLKNLPTEGDKEALRQITERVKELEEEKTACDKLIDGDEFTKLEERKSELESQISALRTKKEGISSEKAAMEAQKGILEETLRKLEKFKGGCLVIPSVDCNVSEEELKKLKKETGAKLTKLKKELTPMGTALGTVESDIDIMREELEGAGKKMQQMAEAKTERSKLNLKLAEKKISLEKLSKRLGEQKSKKTVQEEIERMGKRIEKGEKLVDAVKDFDRIDGDLKKLDEDLEANRQEVADLETLVEAFGPKGIVKNVLSDRITMFEDRVNETLEVLTDGHYSIEISLDPDFEILVNFGEKDRLSRLPLYKLSRSEKMRVGLNLQAAICVITGFSLLVLDEAEMLAPRNKKLLSSFLRKMVLGKDAPIGQAIVVKTITEEDEDGRPVYKAKPDTKDVKRVLIDNGSVIDAEEFSKRYGKKK